MVSRTRTAPLATPAPNLAASPFLQPADGAAPGISASAELVETPDQGTFSKLAYWSLLAFVFIFTSRLSEFLPPSLHLPLVFATLTASLTFIGIVPRRSVVNKTGNFFMLYALWFVICIPFSEWKGGSFQVLTQDFIKSFILFISVAYIVNSTARLRGVLLSISIGAVVAMSIALYLNYRINGRLGMPGGELGNPNDLGQYMMLGMCFLPTLAHQGNKKFFRGITYLMMLPFLYTIFATGSRGVLVSLILIVGVVFLRSNITQKLIISVLFVVLGVGLFGISDTARVRLATLFEDSSRAPTDSVEQVANTSYFARLRTLKQSISLTLQKPLFGVGPGNFESSSAARASGGERAMWLETHNSYTEVSSETGIIGLLFFGGGIITGLMSLIKTQKLPQLKNTSFREVSLFLLVGLGGFLLTMMFSAVAYKPMLWLLLGLCTANSIMLKETIQRLSSAQLRFQPATSTKAGAFSRGARLSQTMAPKRPAPATRVTLSGRIRNVRTPRNIF